ncbi:uncharacterized protein [Drosophila kikkawai]|uniref:Uncharacterized protein n=1 Tax=Drosophila kikkawai TaxID=30033 RepID=A0A6P4HYM0_DROKI|nr:uncharacterized protein LOC108074122 [Drosophila kikkawai]
MSNAFSYWNGQPLNANVYPQMGDLMQPQPGRGPPAGGFGAGRWHGQEATTQAHSPATAPGPYPSAGGAGLGLCQGASMVMPNLNPGAQMGMGDYGTVSSPLTCNVPTNFFSQGQSQYEPCIDNGEAFCAYNGMDMSMNYGGGQGQAQGKGGFW